MNKVITVLLTLFLSSVSFAEHPTGHPVNDVPQSKPVPPEKPCAVLEQYIGEVQIMDGSRSFMLDTQLGSPIPCGGWVSVGGAGWAKIKHRDGFKVWVSQDGFLKLGSLSDNGDHFVVLRGQMYARTDGGAGELRVTTANSRARVSRGAILMVYDTTNEESQLVALDAPRGASLENRFEADKRINIKAGETTSLNSKILRNTPETPRTAVLVDVRRKLHELKVPEDDTSRAVKMVQWRKDRKFASTMKKELVDAEKQAHTTVPSRHEPDQKLANTAAVELQKNPSELTNETKRNPAGLVFNPQNYVRHKEHPEEAKLKEAFSQRVVGGVQGGEKMLYPDRFVGKGKDVQMVLEGDDVQARNKQAQLHSKLVKEAQLHAERLKSEEELERNRLIDQLSAIKPE